jgi:hypothetical protein
MKQIFKTVQKAFDKYFPIVLGYSAVMLILLALVGLNLILVIGILRILGVIV